MKPAKDWLLAVDQAIKDDLFFGPYSPGKRTEAVIKRIQKDAKKKERK
jgi:hypothetical protein